MRVSTEQGVSYRTPVYGMNKRGVERGIATECVGFGQGAATELSPPS